MKEERIWPVFWAAWLLIFPLRLLQQIFLVDGETGFYTDEKLTSYLLTGLLIVGILLFFWLCRKERKTPEESLPVLKSLPGAAGGVLAGLLFAGQGLYSLFGEPCVGNEIINRVLSVVGLATGGVFLCLAYGMAVGKNFLGACPLLGLIPSLWGCICLIAMFITYTAAVNGVENFYDTCTVVFFLLFLFSLAKYLTGTEGPAGIYRYGFPAVLLASVTALPAFVLTLLGKELSSAFSASLHLLNLGLLPFTLAVLWAVRLEENRRAREEA